MLDSDSPILLRCLYYIYNKLVIIIIFLFEISVLLDIYLNFDDFLVVTDNVCVFVGVFMIFFKMLIFQAHREQIARLLHATIKSCDQLCKLTTITGIDSMQLTIGMLSLAQFEILNKHFESCGRDNVGRRREVSTEVNCDEDNYESYEARHRGGFAEWFGRSVRDHQRLRVIIDDFNKIYNMCMFVQMLLSITMICLTSFQLLLVTGQSSTFKFSLYLIAAAMQIFFVCWLGNEVMYQSALLTQSQWLSGWEDELSNTKTGRLLILSMIFSTRTLNIKAGVFYDLNMETFTTVLKGAYSVFVLLNMYSEDQ
ncbi:odorant receptor 2a isoform X2 [Ooceraea biroi]|nr:odorant receptor 2a isoform X2 [Ooceraea biroi]